MASVLHGSARTTPRIRAELKAAQAPARFLASQYGLNVKTVLKWRNRPETSDAPMGPTPKEKGRLVVSLPGGANLKLLFERPMDFLGLYGRRKAITELRVRVDEPGKLREALGRS